MPTLHANPYDLEAKGFYFDSLKDYEKKAAKNRNSFGQKVEEYEIEFIDGTDAEQQFFAAMGVHQGDIDEYFDALDALDDSDVAVRTIYLMDSLDFSAAEALSRNEDLPVMGPLEATYEKAALEEWFWQMVESIGSIEDMVGKAALESNFDVESYMRDMDINGEVDAFQFDGDWYVAEPQAL